jgi:hypothetical protein
MANGSEDKRQYFIETFDLVIMVKYGKLIRRPKSDL